MRHLFTFGSILLLGLELNAQVFEQETIPAAAESYEFQKINIDGKVGIAFPIGDFADSDILSEDAGFAKPGMCFGIEFNAKPKDNVGFGLDITGTTNEYNTAPYDIIAEEDSIFSGINVGNYFNLKMLGVFSLGMANENLEADVKVMIGPMYSVLPEMTLSNSYSGFSISQVRGKSNSLALCAGIGLNTRYYFKSFYLKTFAEYTSATVLHDVDYSVTGLGNVGGETLTTKFRWMNMGVGLGIRF